MLAMRPGRLGTGFTEQALPDARQRFVALGRIIFAIVRAALSIRSLHPFTLAGKTQTTSLAWPVNAWGAVSHGLAYSWRATASDMRALQCAPSKSANNGGVP